MRRLGAIALAILVAALSLVAAGCGGDDEPSGQPSAAEWADGFCTAVSTWTDALERIGEELGDPSSITTDALEQAARDVGDATDEFVADVRALGAPDTESGEEVENSIEELADTVEAEREKIDEALEDASGLTELAGAISAIGASVSAMSSAFQATLQALEDADASGELETALEESEACDEIAD